MPYLWFQILFGVFSFILGTCIGSFLNVCIYRMPRDMAVNQPRRSFCPECRKQIPWHHNIPILGWLMLGGKCGSCRQPISPRYLLVELLTGLLFLALYLKVPVVLVLPYFVFSSLLIVGTFIDLEFFIIPDEITWGGTWAGLLLSLLLPQMMGVDSRWMSLLWSLVGAATGYFLVWGIVEAGKLAFGRRKVTLAPAEQFVIEPDPEKDEPVLRVGGEAMPWVDIFTRESDRLILTVEDVQVNGEASAARDLVFYHDRLEADGRVIPLTELRAVSGVVSTLVIPREAMGFGDVKLMAAVGAFLGWQAVLFTVPVASVLGSVVGLAGIASGHREWSAKIPFGPYLALGALVWIFAGPELLNWYIGLLRH